MIHQIHISHTKRSMRVHITAKTDKSILLRYKKLKIEFTIRLEKRKQTTQDVNGMMDMVQHNYCLRRRT